MNIAERIYTMALKKPRVLVERGLKLNEEAGEVATAILSYVRSPGCEYKECSARDIKEECVDTIIVAYSILADLGCSSEELEEIFDAKLTKWDQVQPDKPATKLGRIRSLFR